MADCLKKPKEYLKQRSNDILVNWEELVSTASPFIMKLRDCVESLQQENNTERFLEKYNRVCYFFDNIRNLIVRFDCELNVLARKGELPSSEISNHLLNIKPDFPLACNSESSQQDNANHSMNFKSEFPPELRDQVNKIDNMLLTFDVFNTSSSQTKVTLKVYNGEKCTWNMCRRCCSINENRDPITTERNKADGDTTRNQSARSAWAIEPVKVPENLLPKSSPDYVLKLRRVVCDSDSASCFVIGESIDQMAHRLVSMMRLCDDLSVSVAQKMEKSDFCDQTDKPLVLDQATQCVSLKEIKKEERVDESRHSVTKQDRCVEEYIDLVTDSDDSDEEEERVLNVIRFRDYSEMSDHMLCGIPRFIYSPGHFYVEFTVLNEGIFSKLQDRLNKWCSSKPIRYTKKIFAKKEMGPFCAALFSEDGKWYRAQVVDWMDSNETTVRVRFVDSGDDAVVSLDSVQPLGPDFIKYPAFVQRCHLSFLSPPRSRRGFGQWPEESCTAFMRAMPVDKVYSYRIVDTDYPTSLGVVVMNDQNDETSINKQLVEDGYAIYVKPRNKS